MFSLPFSALGKIPKIEWSFLCGLNHYLRETLHRGWGTWRYVNECKLYLRHSLEGVRTKIARIVLRHSAAWRNALRMHSSPKLRSKIQELRRSLVQILDLGSARIPLPIPINILSESKILIRSLVGILDLGFCRECILNAFLQNAECPKYKEESKSTFCLLPSVCVFTYVYIAKFHKPKPL